MILIEFTSPDLLDLILESLSVIGYLFVLYMVFHAKKKNKIFGAKPFPVLVIGILLGLTSAIMDVLTEFLWIENYSLFKSVMVSLKIAGLFLFAIGMYLLFRFTQFLLGDQKPEN